MTENLVIDHVGHRGDGVVLRDGASIYVPFALGGETVAVEPVAGHPDRRALLSIAQPSERTDRAVLQAFRRLRRLRDPALAR